MTDAAPSRSVRVRSYREVVRDAGQTFRLAAGVDVRAALKRAALAAVPKVEGWTLRVFTLERTTERERVAALLDRLARTEMGGSDFAAALAATLDGGSAVLVVGAKHAARVERVSSALSGAGR
jgi:uncharacterized ferredoxin-like protein